MRLSYLGQSLLGACALRGHLLRPGLCVLQPGLSLGLALQRNLHCVHGSLLVGAGVGHSCLGRVSRGHGGVKLLLADDVLFHQRLVALQIGLRLGEVGLSLGYASVRRVQLLFRLPHAGLRAAHIGIGRTQIAAGIHGGNRHIHVGRRGVGLGARQSRLGVLHSDLIISRVQLGNRVAGLHHLIFIHVNLGHLACNARADLDQVAVHLRVVGAFAIGRAPPQADGNQRQYHNHGNDDASAAGLRRRALDLFAFVVWGYWG